MSHIIKETARGLRKAQTLAESRMWEIVRNRRYRGWKFVRQYPVTYHDGVSSRFFVMDFYCVEHKTAIEVDGGIHRDRPVADAWRARILECNGIRIVRFQNEEIMDSSRLSVLLHERLSSGQC